MSPPVHRPALSSRGLVVGALGDGEHEPEGVLGDDRRGLARDVADHDAALARGGEVEGVGADPADGRHAEAGQGPERLARPLDRAPRVHKAHGVLRARDALLRRARAVGVHDRTSP